ncbi:dihydrofolate reductase family protein [Arthrobacter sp. LAPM80]|uniref:dihydrofolate reductase family protein n=1 Tax=Arthrobacter sp. LAPM80 TaxID=3141788 RepID=UPI00398AC0AA
MAKLIYAAITSLDGCIEDRDGSFNWAMPDDEVHSYVNNLERDIGTYLYGRRMYETMKYWEPMYADPAQTHVARDYAAIWHQSQKVVYSRSLADVDTAKTRIERTFDPDAVRAMKAEAQENISVGGPELAAAAFKAGLVDEIHLFVSPIVVGGGKQALPDGFRTPLELLDQRNFGNGVVHLHYRVLAA